MFNETFQERLKEKLIELRPTTMDADRCENLGGDEEYYCSNPGASGSNLDEKNTQRALCLNVQMNNVDCRA